MAVEVDPWVAWLRGPAPVRDRALGELRSILVRGLRAAIGGRGADPHFCDDIAQDALVRVLDSLDQFAGRSQFTTWALSIAVRLALTELRRKTTATVTLDPQIIQSPIADDPTHDPTERDYRGAVLSTLHQLVDEALTEHQRTAIRWLLAGLAAEEIGQRMGISRNAAYKLVFDARVKLRDGLTRAGFAAGDVLQSFSS
jgi:RNA polymerase sigma-70 factor (ECF subfamily)